jgi:hypothetical protein
METRAGSTAIAAVVVMTVLAGCDPGPEKAAPAADTPSRSASATPAKNYTAAQLKKALITPPKGAMAVTKGSGSFDKVIAKFSGGAEQPAEEDSSCGTGTLSGTELKQVASVPSAFVSFAQIERNSSVLLVAMPGPLARQAATEPVPQACRSTKTRVGGTTITSKVVLDEAVDIGDGGRIVRNDEMSGGVPLRSWQVTFAGPGYVAMTDVTGDNIGRADAERFARQAYRKASSTLK